MASATIVFSYQEVEKFFSDIRKNVSDIMDHRRVYWSAISVIGFRDVIEHFEKEQGEKSRWKPWGALYRAHMRKIGRGDNKILQDTGRLRQTTMMPVRPTEIKKGYLVFNPAQTSKGFPYAFAHDRGGPILPKRDFMWLSLKAMNQISIVTASYMAKET
jgi:hypothetical protein